MNGQHCTPDTLDSWLINSEDVLVVDEIISRFCTSVRMVTAGEFVKFFFITSILILALLTNKLLLTLSIAE